MAELASSIWVNRGVALIFALIAFYFQSKTGKLEKEKDKLRVEKNKKQSEGAESARALPRHFMP